MAGKNQGINYNNSMEDMMTVFGILCSEYYAVYILDVNRNTMSPVKISEEMKTVIPEGYFDWDEMWVPLIKKLVDKDYVAEIEEMLEREHVRKAFSGEVRFLEKVYRQYTGRWKKLNIVPMESENGMTCKALMTVSDITELRNQMLEQIELKKISETDVLTQLGNRRKLRLRREKIYQNLDACGAVFFDVNDLKLKNDQYGHAEGDRLLEIVAESIQSIINKDVHAYRYGGDEFLVIVCNSEEDEMRHILNMWQTRLGLIEKKRGYKCNVAYGVSWARAPFDFNLLIKEADQKMYSMKEQMKREQTYTVEADLA